MPLGETGDRQHRLDQRVVNFFNMFVSGLLFFFRDDPLRGFLTAMSCSSSLGSVDRCVFRQVPGVKIQRRVDYTIN